MGDMRRQVSARWVCAGSISCAIAGQREKHYNRIGSLTRRGVPDEEARRRHAEPRDRELELFDVCICDAMVASLRPRLGERRAARRLDGECAARRGARTQRAQHAAQHTQHTQHTQQRTRPLSSSSAALSGEWPTYGTPADSSAAGAWLSGASPWTPPVLSHTFFWKRCYALFREGGGSQQDDGQRCAPLVRAPGARASSAPLHAQRRLYISARSCPGGGLAGRLSTVSPGRRARRAAAR